MENKHDISFYATVIGICLFILVCVARWAGAVFGKAMKDGENYREGEDLY